MHLTPRMLSHRAAPLGKEKAQCSHRAPVSRLQRGSSVGAEGQPKSEVPNEAGAEGRCLPDAQRPGDMGNGPAPAKPPAHNTEPRWCLEQGKEPHLYPPQRRQARQEGQDRELLQTVGDYSRLCGESEKRKIADFFSTRKHWIRITQSD